MLCCTTFCGRSYSYVSDSTSLKESSEEHLSSSRYVKSLNNISRRTGFFSVFVSVKLSASPVLTGVATTPSVSSLLKPANQTVFLIFIRADHLKFLPTCFRGRNSEPPLGWLLMTKHFHISLYLMALTEIKLEMLSFLPRLLTLL